MYGRGIKLIVLIGEALSCKFIFAHVVISKKKLLTLYVELKSTYLPN
jgi:hypothetical protein